MKPENADLLRCIGQAYLKAARIMLKEGDNHDAAMTGLLAQAFMQQADETATAPNPGPMTRPEPIKTAEAPDDAIPIRKGMENARTTTGRVRPQRPKQQPAVKAAKPDGL